MKLFLLRHAETEHNVAGLLAGVTDSALTNHGVLQTQRLGKYLAERYTFTQIFSSDLQRARMTAKAVQDAQRKRLCYPLALEVVTLKLLREQDFGSFECMPWSSKQSDLTAHKLPKPDDVGFKPKETAVAMTKRADVFLEDYIMPQLAVDSEQENTVAVVSHGLFLSTLWKTLLKRFQPGAITLGPEIGNKTGSRPLEYLPGWSNTGYVELDILPNPPTIENSGAGAVSALVPMTETPTLLPGWKMVVRGVNCKDHLTNLKRTRGVGSSAYDARQKKLEGYFKKPKLLTEGSAESSTAQAGTSALISTATLVQPFHNVPTEQAEE